MRDGTLGNVPILHITHIILLGLSLSVLTSTKDVLILFFIKRGGTFENVPILPYCPNNFIKY